jgi:hypothetical protein
LRGRLKAGLERAGLTEPQVTVRTATAEQLVRHPVSGKTRRFVPLAQPVLPTTSVAGK